MKSFLQPCSKELFHRILEDIGSSEIALQRDIKYLMEWMAKQPHLPIIEDEEILTNLLILSKNRVEKAKRLMHLFYTAKARWPYLCENRDVVLDRLQSLKRFGLFVPLPKLTPDGYRVLIWRLNKLEAEDIPSWEFMFQCCMMFIELALKIDCFKGVTVIVDLENMSSVVASVMVTVSTKGPALLAAKNTPARIDRIYVLNLHPVFQWVLTFTKNILKPKITEKIILWDKKMEYLSEELPSDILPAEFGGTEKPLNELCDDFIEYVNQFRDEAMALAEIKADPSKIPENYKYKESDAEWGADGTFRNLNIE